MYEINGIKYPIIGHVERAGTFFPLLDIPMMSDEKFNRLATENAIKHYIEAFGKDPESAEAALKWQDEDEARLMRKYEGQRITTRLDESGYIIREEKAAL